MKELKKRCSSCKEYKDLDQFCKNKAKKDGLSNTCKQCDEEYRENNKKKIAEKQKEKWIKIACSEQRTIENRKKMNEWRKNNKDKVDAYNSITRAKNRIYSSLVSKIKEVAQEDQEVIDDFMNYVTNYKK